MKFLVTGGAGFIGSNIVEKLITLKHKVRVIDNFSSGKLENIKPFLKNIELIKGDIRKEKDLKKSLKNIDFVLHQAAIRSVPRSIDDPLTSNSVNICGTLKLLYLAKIMKIKRVVYASSSSVYGDCKSFPQEEGFPASPISPYAVSKLAGENYCQVYAKTLGLETVSLRYFNVFGPKQDPKSKYAPVVPKFIIYAFKKLPLEIYGDGLQSRDFTYIDNVVNANIQAALTPGISGNIFNISCGKPITVNYIAESISRILNLNLDIKHTKPRLGDVRKTYADVSKAKKLMNFNPDIHFEEGLRKTIDWFIVKTNK